MTGITDFPVFDGHNDVLYSLYVPHLARERSFFNRSKVGHIDLPRAREGGFGGGFFAVYVPSEEALAGPVETDLAVTSTGYEVRLAEALEQAYALRTTLAVMALLFRLESESQGQLRVVRTACEIESCLRGGVVAAVLHIEGAEAIDPGLDTLHVFHRAGLRSIGPVWSRPNIFGHGVPFKWPSSPDTGPGLTELGKDLVRMCNRLRIMLDLSHLNERGFWDVAALTDAPLVVTHAAAHSICATTRNLTDKQLDAIAESDGMVGVNFNVSDLREDSHRDPNTPITAIVRHIDYMVERIGIDRVGFGSDFDGATMPLELGDVSGLPKLVLALSEHGYDDAALKKLTHENWVRVLRKTWGE